MTPDNIAEWIKYGIALLTGGVGVYWSQMARSKADGSKEGTSSAELHAIAARVSALEDQHAELLRHVNERATKADVQAMARDIITQMDARFANLIALLKP